MYQKSAGQNTKNKNNQTQKDTLEAIKDLGSSKVKKTGAGIFDQFFGGSNYDYDQFSGEFGSNQERQQSVKPRQEFKVFNYQEYYERDLIKKQIKELTEQIRKEIELIKKADAFLLEEVRDVQKLTLESFPDKPGIYHIRFLEIVLSILRTLRAKIGESKTWMQALISKKKKRGSLFLVRSKKQGTQYSLSQELQTARSVQ